MVIGFIIRCGIVAGAVYYSRELGIWGSTDDSEQLYNNIKKELRPHAKDLGKKMPFEVPALPETGEFRYLAKHYYNEGIKGTFYYIEMLPCYTGRLLDRAREEFQKFAQAPPTAESKVLAADSQVKEETPSKPAKK